MKKITTMLTLLVLCFSVYSQKGIQFDTIGFSEALSKAKAENKLIFMDCYTSWCGPCKHMLKNVFTQEKAGKFFNSHFICMKFDMEKGEGKELAKKYAIKSYPTFLLIQPDGNVRHKILGISDIDEFISKVQRGMNKKTSFAYLDPLFQQNKLNKKQLIAYLAALDDAYETEKSKKVEQLLVSQLNDKDKLKPDFWPILSKSYYRSDDYYFIVNHLSKLRRNIGVSKVDSYLLSTYNQALNTCIVNWGNKQVCQDLIKQIKQDLSGLTFESKEKLADKTALAQACADTNHTEIISGVEKLLPKSKGPEIIFLFYALEIVKKQGTEADFKRIVLLGEKLISETTDPAEKEYYQNFFEKFKILSCTGIYFQDLTFEQALAKAQKQNKLLFIDCYTSWCGPCKIMATQIFPQKKVGKFFNDKFISLKFDMEKGEGPALKEKYNIHAYPTFLLIKPDGSLQHKIIGGANEDDFIRKISQGLNDSTSLGSLEAKYQAGCRDKKILVNYIHALTEVADPKLPDIVTTLFQSLSEEEKFSPDYWFIFDNLLLSPVNSVPDRFLVSNYATYKVQIGKEKVDSRLILGYSTVILNILCNQDTTMTLQELNKLSQEAKSLNLNPILQKYFRIARIAMSGTHDQIISFCEKELPHLDKGKLVHQYLTRRLYTSIRTEHMERWRKLGKTLKN